METPWRRSIFFIFLILSLNDVHVFCQNVAPCGPQSQLLNNEVNRECPNVNSNCSPQMRNALLSVAAANGILPEMLPTLGPIIPGNLQLQEAISQQQDLLPFSPQGLLFPPGLSQSSGLLNPNLILPSPNLPASLSCSPLVPTLLAPPPSVSPGLIPQHPLPPSIQSAVNFQNPFITNGIVRPINPRPSPANLPLACNGVSESIILDTNTVAINPAFPNAVRPIDQPFISPRQQCINLFTANSYPANQNLQSELNLIAPLQTNQQVVNQFSGNNNPVPTVLPGNNPLPVCHPIIKPYDIFHPNSIIFQQPQILSTPSNFLSSETIIETEVNSQLSTLQENRSSLLSAENDVAITNTVNTAITEIQQPAVFAEERGQQLPFNVQINIPPLSLPAPSITLINTPPNIPAAPAPASAPVVPSFGAYPLIQPIIVEGSKSKLSSWLPILLAVLLSDDEFNSKGCGCGCGCCGSCCCTTNNIPIPYPIPIPVNNPIISTSGKPRKSNKSKSLNDDVDDEEE